MKSGWSTKKLGEVCLVDKCQGVHKNLPYVGLEHVESHTGRFIGSIEPFNVKSTTFKFSPDHLLYGRLRPYLNKVMLPEFEGHCSTELFPLRPRQGLAREFLQYWLLMDSTVKKIAATSTGARMPRASISAVLEFEFPLTSLQEQRRIVGILDEAFEGIAAVKANAEKNLQNARALFEGYLESLFTQRGSGWVKKSVEELVSEGSLFKPFDGNHGEIHPRKVDFTASGVPFIMASDLKNGDVDTEHCKFVSRKLADSLRVGFAKDGDVLISHKGTIGRSAIVSTDADYIMLTPQVTSYRVKDSGKLLNRFIRYYFMSPVFQREMSAGAEGGATRAYIGITKQLALWFRFPPLKEQREIAAKLDALDREIQCLESLYEQKLASLEALKKSLLHQAFTGNL
jgi:type I restriction enzyme, S subunit